MMIFGLCAFIDLTILFRTQNYYNYRFKKNRLAVAVLNIYPLLFEIDPVHDLVRLRGPKMTQRIFKHYTLDYIPIHELICNCISGAFT